MALITQVLIFNIYEVYISLLETTDIYITTITKACIEMLMTKKKEHLI